MTITARELSQALALLPNFNEFAGEYFVVELRPAERYFSDNHARRVIARTVEFKKRNGEWVLHSLPHD